MHRDLTNRVNDMVPDSTVSLGVISLICDQTISFKDNVYIVNSIFLWQSVPSCLHLPVLCLLLRKPFR